MSWRTKLIVLVLMVLGSFIASKVVNYYRNRPVEATVVEKKVEPKVTDDCWGNK